MKLAKDTQDGSAARLARISAVVRRTYKEMAKDLGVSIHTMYNISGGHDNITRPMAERIVATYPRFSLAWVLRGEGEMLQKNANARTHASLPEVLMVPVLNLDARGGLLANDSVDVPQYTLAHMPFSADIAKEGDVVMPVFGDSMSPKYPSGAMVLIRRVELWREYLELGATYVLELTDGRRVLKQVKRGEKRDTLLLESINPEYPPSEVPASLVANVFRVILLVRQDTL